MVKKVVGILLAVALLACIGTSVYTRQTPILTGVFVVLLIAFGLAVLFSHKSSGDTQQPEPATTYLERLADEFTKASSGYQLPYPNTPTVAFPVRLHSSLYIEIDHFCWKNETHLFLFPSWKHITEILRQIENQVGAPLEDIILPMPIKISLNSIVCFARELFDREYSPMVLLHFWDVMGREIGLSFGEDAYQVFKSLIPHKELNAMRSKRYPQSAQQISDITTKMQQLKALRMQALIDEEEYAEKKRQLLTGL